MGSIFKRIRGMLRFNRLELAIHVQIEELPDGLLLAPSDGNRPRRGTKAA